MPQTTMTLRTDSDVKARFDSFCADVGMNASVAINMFMRATVAHQALPFQVRRCTPEGLRDIDAMSHEELLALLDARKKRFQSNDLHPRSLDDVLGELKNDIHHGQL